MASRLISGTIAVALLVAGSAYAAPAARPPFVGCRSDGQTGPLPAPKSDAEIPRVPARLAARLAYYRSEALGVLGPRGWRCFGLYGSNGESLFVTPAHLGRDPFSAHLTGPAIQLSTSIGDTSGRFEAAQIAARLFPNRSRFVATVVAEGLEPKADFPADPFPDDIIRRVGPDVVEFETPAGHDGMGTKSRLVKNSDPVRGVAIMDENNDATVLVARLPPTMRDLTDVIHSAREVTDQRRAASRGGFQTARAFPDPGETSDQIRKALNIMGSHDQPNTAREI